MISLFVRGNGVELGSGPHPRPSGIGSLSYSTNLGREPTACTRLGQMWSINPANADAREDV